jgi:LacI family transcriptional regulator
MLRTKVTSLKGNTVTLKQIAEKVGVSAAAVSKALSDRSDIAPKTRARIKKIAQQMGYSVNVAARTLATNRTMTLGVIVPFPRNPTVVERLRGIQASALEAGYLTSMSFHDGVPEDERKQIRLMANRVDGLIITPVSQTKELADVLTMCNVPVVCMSEPLQCLETDYVGDDDRLGGRFLGEHLLQTGRSRFAYFGETIWTPSDKGLLEGLREVLSDSASKLAFLREHTTWDNFTREQTLRNIQRILTCEARPDAILSFCDQTSLWIFQELVHRGFRVPQDVAICGYDNNEHLEYVSVPLTSVAQPNYEIGSQSVCLLLDRLRDKNTDYPFRKVIYSPELIVRQSTAVS